MFGSYDQADRSVRTFETCLYRFLVEKQDPDQIVKDSSECADSVNTFGVSYIYLQQIADLDLAAAWKNVGVPVLVRWGTSDPTTRAEESRYLVEIINSFHTGRALMPNFRVWDMAWISHLLRVIGWKPFTNCSTINNSLTD